MPETQHGDQIEQDQIAQSERAYELRAGLCRLRGHKRGKRDKINYSEFNREMIDEMNRRLSDGHAQRTALLKNNVSG
jgi:hypothetical protein